MKKRSLYQTVVFYLLLLGGMFLVSFALLGLLSVIIWKFDGGEKILSGGIILIYILVNVIGGFLAGKRMGKQKFFWGLLVGALFWGILLLAGVLFAGTVLKGNTRLFAGLMICAVSGMLGGMLSPGGKGGK